MNGTDNKKTGAEEKAERRSPEASRVPAGLLLLLLKIVLIALFFVLLFMFVFGITRVRDNSMAPAVKEGDLVIYYRFRKNCTARDVIALDIDGGTEIRRVIATAGDRVDITPDGLEINGYAQMESSIYTDTKPYAEGIDFPVIVGAGEVFVLGDNRTESKDSRIYGPAEKDAILGTVVAVIRRRGF